MIRQSLFLAFSCALSSAFQCTPDSACDNGIAKCGEGMDCHNPSGKPLGGCCVPEGTKIEEVDQPAVADYVKENCGHAFACDNEIAICSSHSKCVNPSGEALSGCCIPKNMDPNEMETGLPLKGAEGNGESKTTSEFEHLRGIVHDYVIDNCGPAFACDNANYGCSDHSKCVGDTDGEMLSGCCIPKEMDVSEWEAGVAEKTPESMNEQELESHLLFVSDYVAENCGIAFACDSLYGCSDHSKCVGETTGETLSGCCIPKEMDPNEIEKGHPIGYEGKKISEFEHLRGIVHDYVIDNCGPAFACDNANYGCSDHSKCIGDTEGEMLSGCCIPKEMDPNEVNKGLPIKPANDAEAMISEFEHLRGIVHDYVIDNCGPAFACDNANYGCSDHSKCVGDTAGEMLSGCCIPKEMDVSEWKAELEEKNPEKMSEQELESHLPFVSDYVAENCGIAFACDSLYGCSDHSKCVIETTGETLSGCCIPKEMDPNEMERGLPLTAEGNTEKVECSSNPIEIGSLNGIDLQSIIAPYVLEYCGPAFACDNIGAACDDTSTCINPSEGPLAGCCVPKGMTREDLEGANSKFESKFGEFGSLNGIDLASIIAPYVLENCGPAFACDEIGAHCDSASSCINPSQGPLAGCCVPKGMTREELETGVLTKKREEEKEEEEREDICSTSLGQCIPRVFIANETKYHSEL